jgi:hypothetical protein
MGKHVASVRVELHHNKALRALASGGKDGLKRAATLVKRVADSRVPTGGETGLLETSGIIREFSDQVVDVRYGGNGAYWGVILHAHPEYDFQQGRQADFLESATADTNAIAQAIAEGVKSGFKGVV